MLLQYSGSCILVLLIFNDICYIANLGNSKAIISMDDGKQYQIMTNDHSTKNQTEIQRILANGGQLYEQQLTKELQQLYNSDEPIIRILPGKLNVTRTIGDGQAKLAKFGGKEGVILSQPEIFSFSITSAIDFALLGSAGLFQKLQPEKILKEI
eukprot:TRINITY_DN35027_c0_g1_i1.p1 TRINITY_DN35027_c0_g1~~TRINITY_DN35027_c0_g1_i1.p1  ORF type:complete len:154 (-),score=23.93 TRINITY_DN35027_c0_g1_i1:90-551(-)